MNLINLEIGKWLYLIIYFFFPTIALLYLIRTYGLDPKEDAAETIQRHLEQAHYWADIARKMTQSENGTKSMTSLLYTIRRNLDEAEQLLETAVLSGDQRRDFTFTYNEAVKKVVRLQEQNKTTPLHSTLYLK
jgi:hypothetical protein